MTDSLFFYDLETSGLDPKQARIMQFAGQRTDLNLKLISEPYNFLVKLSNDVLPSPEAIIITGITPQMTLIDGINEAEFTKIFNQEIATSGTTFIGYNNIRFDDEFIRYTNYRNFFEPYEWHYSNGRKRWDMLDVIRMTRALRPEGINWPINQEKLPVNKLTDITSANNISHKKAHDAIGDVEALIDVARLIKSKQPKIFDYLYKTMTNKNEVERLLKSVQPVLYTFGGYSGHPLKTTAVIFLADIIDVGILVYDLRQDPKKLDLLSKDQLKVLICNEDPSNISPFLLIKSNKCPAISPMSVLDDSSEASIGLDKKQIKTHQIKLKSISSKLTEEIINAFKNIYSSRVFKSDSVDDQLYDKFFDRSDSNKLSEIRSLRPELLNQNTQMFNDKRLNKLIFLYKARNYPKYLSSEETIEYEKFRYESLFSGGVNSKFSRYINELTTLGNKESISSGQQYIVEELKLYAESIVPSEL